MKKVLDKNLGAILVICPFQTDSRLLPGLDELDDPLPYIIYKMRFQDQSTINLVEEVKQTICGLEISFSSAPQDIDIKLIPTCDNCLEEEEAGQ